MSLVSCRILIVDNYDSFTYNLYQLLYECTGVAPHVVHHDSEWAHVENLLVTCDGIVIGPGPGRPENESDFGICARLLQQDRIPVLGICLGLQGLAHIYGGSITHARQPLHGRLCRVYHDGESALLAGIPNGFKVVRYNSLVVAPHSLPACLRISAWSNISDGTCSVHDSHSEVLPFRRVDPADFEDIEVMGLEHATLPKYSVQYHPESICTQFGAALVRNFLATCNRRAESLSMPTVQPTLTVSQLPSTSNTLKPLIFEFEWRDPQLYFDALFASAKNSFWLDSSRVETNSSRFAFMGDNSGPNAHLIQYCVQSRTMSTFQSASSDAASWQRPSRYVLPPETDVFDALRTHMSQYTLADQHAVLSSLELHDSTDLLNIPISALPLQSESPPLEFNLLGGWVGYLGYELRRETEPAGDSTLHSASFQCVSDAARRSLIDQHYSQPDLSLVFADRYLVFDHHLRKVYAIALVPLHSADQTVQRSNIESALHWFRQCAEISTPSTVPASGPPESDSQPSTLEFDLNLPQVDYLAAIQSCLSQIRDGESYELCLTNQFFTAHRPCPLALFSRLRKSNPVPYAALLSFSWSDSDASAPQHLSVVCSSPERFLTIQPGSSQCIESKPIKGTLPRGRTAEEDEQFKQRLAHNEKDFAENLMIVDLLRNDLGRVCQVGSVHVPKLMNVESYATVHQLVSTVRGTLRPDASACEAMRACFPPGSMTGAPKLRSCQILDALERRQPRGVYSGCLGYFSLNGAADFNVVIRTAVITDHGMSLGAGGAIVHQSSPTEEFDEVLLKTKAVLSAVALQADATVRINGTSVHS